MYAPPSSVSTPTSSAGLAWTRRLLPAAVSLVMLLGFGHGVASAGRRQVTCNGVPATIVAKKNDVMIWGPAIITNANGTIEATVMGRP